MVLATALGIIAGGILLLATLWWIMRPKLPSARLPPAKTGWIPWVGCAIPFGKEPLYFIQRTKEEFGTDLFTIYAAGKTMTIVTEPKHFPHYFQSTQLDFQAAVQPFTKKAAGLSPEAFFKYHSAIHDTVKGKLIPTYINKMCPILSHELYNSLCCHGNEGEMDLMDFVREAMFQAVVRQLFGEENMPKTPEAMREMQRKFVKYDEDFEYGTELPEIFLKDWRECKQWLLSLFKLVVAGMVEDSSFTTKKKDEKTLLEQMLEAVSGPSAPHFALLLLWASQANAIPAVFWTLARILSNPDIYRALKADVEHIQLLSEDSEFCSVSEEKLKEVMSVKRCILEAVRLNAPGMIPRKVTETHNINGYTVPAGHLLMLSPYWSHRNPEKFPNPESFNPDRWLECDLSKNQFLDGFVGFGGGRYQCPGRWFALMEMHLFVSMILRLFDLELIDPVPPPSPLHLVGIQQPTTRCRVHYKRCH